MTNFTRPISDAKLEAEAQIYAANYRCDIETARRDVMDESGATDTETDDFYARMEER